MPKPVALDAPALRVLADRVEDAAADLGAISIPGVPAPGGSALAALDAPRRAAAEVRRHGALASQWATAARRCAEALQDAEQAGADGLRLR